jgi:hypothetical protein
MTITKTQDGTKKVTFRIPLDLYERIKKASDYSGRPLNSEVITWLQFRDIAAALDELNQQNQELRRIAIDTLEAVTARK